VQLFDRQFVFSPSDVVNHLFCPHLTQLNRRVAEGELEKPDESREDVALISELGDAHEMSYLRELSDEGKSIVEIDLSGRNYAAAQAATEEAMADGVDVVFQATFFDGLWLGHADFLINSGERTESVSSTWGGSTTTCCCRREGLALCFSCRLA